MSNVVAPTDQDYEMFIEAYIKRTVASMPRESLEHLVAVEMYHEYKGQNKSYVEDGLQFMDWNPEQHDFAFRIAEAEGLEITAF